MLIVNADDWGRTRAETDAAVACFSQGRVTSVTAMTFMIDSERAAGVALDRNIPVGLHLNFVEPPTAAGVSRLVLNEHCRLASFLTRTPYSALVPNPILYRSFRSAFQMQLDEFIRLYGKAPTHFDGHRHLHLCPSMLFAAPIPTGERVRRTFTFTIAEKGLLNWLYRRALDRWVARRYRTTNYFFALSQRMIDVHFARVILLARRATVELMAHPAVPAERSFLLAPEIETELSGVSLGTYAQVD